MAFSRNGARVAGRGWLPEPMSDSKSEHVAGTALGCMLRWKELSEADRDQVIAYMNASPELQWLVLEGFVEILQEVEVRGVDGFWDLNKLDPLLPPT